MTYSSRRRFLAGLISAAVIATVPQTAKSWTHGVATPSTGKSILNLANPSFGPYQYSFINFFKGLTVDNSSILSQGVALTASGTPAASPTGNPGFGTMQVPPSYTGNWVLKWSGTGALRLDIGVAFTVSVGSGFLVGSGGHVDATGTNVRVVFLPNTPIGTITCNWLALGTYSGMGAPVLCRADQEAALDASGYFNPDYVSQITAIKPRAIRVMQSTNAATGVIAKSSTYNTPLGYISWSGPTVPLGAYIGTIGGTNTYTCSTPTDGSDTIVGFVTNSSGNVASTLNGISLVDGQANAYNAGGDGLIGGVLYTFTKDAILNKYYSQASGVQSFIPIEVLVALANQCNVSLYYCFNVAILDAEATAIAQYIKDNLNMGLVAYFEYANEIWGGVGQYNIGPVIARNDALGFTHGFGPYQGLRHRQLMGIVTGVWNGGTPRSLSTLKRVAASATYNSGSIGPDLLAGASLGAYGYDVKPNRPVDFTDVLSFAPYYEGPSCPAFQTGYVSGSAQQALYDAADNYASGNSTLMGLALDFVDADIKNGTGGNGDVSTIDYQNTNVYPGWNTLAASYDGDRPSGMGPLVVECYEGGLQIQRPTAATLNAIGKSGATYGDDTGRIAILFAAYKNDARWQSRLTYQFNQFMTFSHSVSPCWYSFVGVIPVGGTLSDQWSSHIGDLYSTPYKTVPALTAFNA